MAAPLIISPPPRGAASAAPAISASSGGRTVPIAGGSTSIPILNPVTRPIEARNRARQVIVGDVLRDRYVIKNIVGLGGTGTVFEAIDRYRLDLPDSGQRVAIKVLHADTNDQSAVPTDLRREFQLLQSLSHPNIVRANEYDRDGDTAFFTMEYLSGLSLENVISAQPEVVLERTHALIIIRDVAAALEHAHARGVVHGDLNPGNIFITNDGQIRVLDFGAAHTPSQTPFMTETAWDATAYATPRYASCQLLDGERADARDDTYALACVLYVLLAGKHPFGELNAAQARAQRQKLRRPAGLTGKQWHALRTGLSFDRQRRPVDLAAWLEPFDLPKPEARLPVLLALLKAAPRRTRRSGAAVLVVVLLALAAAGWWASGHMDLVSQTAADAGVNVSDAVASAHAGWTRLWEGVRSALSSSSAPETEPAAAPSSSAAPEGEPPTARPVEAPPTATRPSVPASAPAARVAATPRAAMPAMAAPAASAAAGVLGRSASAPAAPPSHTRIELSADTVDVPSTDPAAHVIVKRTGNLHADAGFTWWTESGTAKPGQDFMAVKAHEEHFEDGKAVANLFVPVVADPTRKQAKSFYIVINDPSDGAALGKRTLTMVTIPPAE
jgi:serine/threonine protein kinase